MLEAGSGVYGIRGGRLTRTDGLCHMLSWAFLDSAAPGS